ncbi:DUF6243 family protein [Streptomyces spiramyceticus]|uniref:DUF6243 family protein n=1 Tax=Streptomyces spiramyceticus TaxID=299717 RepID=UPI00237AB78C|nr:DUF6243 family protein [Streptomyces spiramyceticus]
MAKSRNNLLGVGGQRKRMSRAEIADNGPTRNADRKTAAEQKEELVRKMRERATPQEDGSEATAEGAQGTQDAQG